MRGSFIATSVPTTSCAGSSRRRTRKGVWSGESTGSLTDYDLSSFMATMNSDYKKTSQQRTGIPPYMAHELLRGTSVLHLYRHDLESLFYIMLLTAACHTIGTPEREDKPRVILRRYDTTLGRCVTYATIMARVPNLTGELQGLVIRDPKYQPVPAEEPPVGTATS